MMQSKSSARTAPRTPRRSPAIIERLESRELLSATTPRIIAHHAVVHAVEGTPFTQVALATFTDAQDGALTNDTASIRWGDGATSIGAISAGTDGAMIVTASHDYSKFGLYRAVVQISDPDGRSVKAVAPIHVQDAAITASAMNITAVRNGKFTTQVATFTDANPNAVLAKEKASIRWGDGSISAGVVTQNPSTGQFQVTGTHDYSGAKDYYITVVAHDNGPSRSLAVADASVSPPLPVITPGLVGDYRGKVKIGGMFSLAGTQPLEVDITGQTVDSVTGKIELDGITVIDDTLPANGHGELSNGNFQYTDSGSGFSFLISGHISPDGKTITKGYINASGSLIGISFYGTYTMTLQ